jgi:uncharacterized protein YdiU (UPF0061 family)
MSDSLAFPFDNTYARDLEGFYARARPVAVASPRLLFLNRGLADELRLDPVALDTAAGAAVFAGNAVPEGADPLAQAYAGHQFGNYSPRLGDGRALLLGEVVDRLGHRRDLMLKGSGRTPFSRGGDGRAAVGPMLREVLIGEAMHALGIPTTRALAVAATGEPVLRDQPLPGAVLTRVAASHLRVGTFEFFAAGADTGLLRRLADYAIARHDPDLAGTPGRFLALLRRVGGRQARLVAQWMNVGFIHGVMNTDNVAVSGETIDYGPCAFMDAYDPGAVFSSIDRGGRYAFGNQPLIARWNLARLAEALLPLIAEDDTASAIERAVAEAGEVIDAFPQWYESALLEGRRAKLGLGRALPEDDAGDAALAEGWLSLLGDQGIDLTLAWRHLAEAAQGDDAMLRALFASPEALDPWLHRWRERCAREDTDSTSAGTGRAARMRLANPLVIPRNHLVEEALAAASARDDMVPFDRLLAALRKPFEALPEHARYTEPAPAAVTAAYRTFCGT